MGPVVESEERRNRAPRRQPGLEVIGTVKVMFCVLAVPAVEMVRAASRRSPPALMSASLKVPSLLRSIQACRLPSLPVLLKTLSGIDTKLSCVMLTGIVTPSSSAPSAVALAFGVTLVS